MLLIVFTSSTFIHLCELILQPVEGEQIYLKRLSCAVVSHLRLQHERR